jgi:NitT/TauT family transport system permease protein
MRALTKTYLNLGRASGRFRRLVAPAATLILVGVAWAVSVKVAGVPSVLLPAPDRVWNAALAHHALLLDAGGSTLSEILLAFLLAIAGGFMTAVALTLWPTARRAIFPYILTTQVVPKVALAPILVAWFGTGTQSRLILAILIAFFPMVINTLSGLLGTSRSMLRYAASLDASEWQALVKVRMPAALPLIMAGIKITATLAVIGVVVGEFVASDRGLGKVILESIALLDTALALAATFAIALVGIALLGVVDLVERVAVYWRFES